MLMTAVASDEIRKCGANESWWKKMPEKKVVPIFRMNESVCALLKYA